MGYHDGKPIESVVYCLKKTSWKVQAYSNHAGVVDVSENGTSERSERVRFLIQKQRVRIYRAKHIPSGIVFII